MAATSADIVRAYRHLYRGLLRAVQYSKPARFTARNQLRTGFRKGSIQDFNQEKISKTLEFLVGAERERGLEHKIVKNLLYTAWNEANFHKYQCALSPLFCCI